MKARVDRSTLLTALETARAGLAQRAGTVEQSVCYVFRDGDVITFDDEAAVRGPSGLPKDFRGAITASKMLELLRRMSDDYIWVTADGGEFVVQGKGRRGSESAGLTMDIDILLPIDSVEDPGEWSPLAEDFCEAIAKVQGVASGDDKADFKLTCVHLAPDWVEACDGYQACRWHTPTGFRSSMLVKRDKVAACASMNVVEFSETENWVHFRSRRGFVLSCRRYVEEFPSEDVTALMEHECRSVVLPKGMKEALEKANIFSAETTDSNLIEVRLEKGGMTLSGTGPGGWYCSEPKPVSWTEAPLAFLIPPKLLADLASAYNEIHIGTDVLRIQGGSYIYVARITPPSAGDNGEGEESGE